MNKHNNFPMIWATFGESQPTASDKIEFPKLDTVLSPQYESTKSQIVFSANLHDEQIEKKRHSYV